MLNTPTTSERERPVWPEQVLGGKYVRQLQKHLENLRTKSPHGNQQLFLDDVFITYLLAFYNPTIRSLRTLEDFSQTRQAQRHLSIRKICKSTLSDFNQLCAPQRLEPLLAALRKELSRKSLNQSRTEGADGLQDLLDRTVAVDGTFLPAMADVCWAIVNRNQYQQPVSYRARLDARIDVTTWIPEAIVVPDPGQSEADCAIAHLKPGQLYLYDRGYQSFALLRAHFATDPSAPAHANFVARFKPAGGNSPQLQESCSQELTAEDREAGVRSDRLGHFVSTNAKRARLPNCLLREVIVEFEEAGELRELRLMTNLLDVSAATIALLYRYRWQVELFFRWLKTVANFNHLLSHSPQGMLMQLYTTIIGVMLMYLHTGYRPSKYLFALLAGGAELEDILPILQERERRCARDRESQRRRAAKKKAEKNKTTN